MLMHLLRLGLAATFLTSCVSGNTSAGPDQLSATVVTTDGVVSTILPTSIVKIRRGNPFGVILFESFSQPRTLLHPDSPIGDWEWFWFDTDGQVNSQKRVKLIAPLWREPEVDRQDDAVRVTYRKTVDLDGKRFDLMVEYTVRDRLIDATFRVWNRSTEPVDHPYMMVGFPGFSSASRINEVSIGGIAREPTRPYLNFNQEIVKDGRSELTLMEELWDTAPDSVSSRLSMFAFGARFEVKASYIPSDRVVEVAARHVVKPAYMTSHLYIEFETMQPNDQSTARVRYELLDSLQKE